MRVEEVIPQVDFIHHFAYTTHLLYSSLGRFFLSSLSWRIPDLNSQFSIIRNFKLSKFANSSIFVISGFLLRNNWFLVVSSNFSSIREEYPFAPWVICFRSRAIFRSWVRPSDVWKAPRDPLFLRVSIVAINANRHFWKQECWSDQRSVSIIREFYCRVGLALLRAFSSANKGGKTSWPSHIVYSHNKLLPTDNEINVNIPLIIIFLRG